jgi:hypothetical protein
MRYQECSFHLLSVVFSNFKLAGLLLRRRSVRYTSTLVIGKGSSLVGVLGTCLHLNTLWWKKAAGTSRTFQVVTLFKVRAEKAVFTQKNETGANSTPHCRN